MLWKKLAVVLGAVGVVALLAYGLTRNPRDFPSPLVDRKAPEFSLTLFDGRKITLEELKGKPVVVNFWASWCIPCREEAPWLEAAWRKYKKRGVVFLGINIQDRKANARAFIKEFGITYLNGVDPRGKISIDYGVYGVPETFFLDRQGKIAYKHLGVTSPSLLEEKIAEILSEGGV